MSDRGRLEASVDGEHREYLLKHMVSAVRRLTTGGTSEDWQTVERVVEQVKNGISLSMKKKNISDFCLFSSAMIIVMDAMHRQNARDSIHNSHQSRSNTSLLFSNIIANPLPDSFVDLSLILIDDAAGIGCLTFFSIYELIKSVLAMPASSRL
jgi:hypothetical protein